MLVLIVYDINTETAAEETFAADRRTVRELWAAGAEFRV